MRRIIDCEIARLQENIRALVKFRRNPTYFPSLNTEPFTPKMATSRKLTIESDHIGPANRIQKIQPDHALTR